MAKNDFEDAKVNEIPDGKMKHVEVDGKELLIASVGDKFYAISDRCGHMNAILTMGNLTGKQVTYSMVQSLTLSHERSLRNQF
ncbi:MAG: Rieske 2Fe-2S domain-containing protein [Candidatus Nitrosopolaris sp.]